MSKKIILVSVLFFICSAISISAQSRHFEEGVGGSGFNLTTVFDSSGLTAIGFSTGYSIGGIMDFGVSLNTQSGMIDSYESTDLGFSLYYNMLVFKQNTLQPINVQLEGSYGYKNTISEYLDNFSRDRTSQGFSLGVLLFHNLFSGRLFSFSIGGKMDYTNYITSIFDYTDPDLLDTVSKVRTEEIRYGGFAGVSFSPALLPIFNAELLVMYDNDKARNNLYAINQYSMSAVLE